jgi:hypothetical protein
MSILLQTTLVVHAVVDVEQGLVGRGRGVYTMRPAVKATPWMEEATIPKGPWREIAPLVL